MLGNFPWFFVVCGHFQKNISVMSHRGLTKKKSQMPRQSRMMIWHFLHIGQTKIASHFKSEWPPLSPCGTCWGQKSHNHFCMQIFDPSVQQALCMIKWNILKLFEILSWNWYLQSEIFFIIKCVHAKAQIKRDVLLFLHKYVYCGYPLVSFHRFR